MTTSSDRIYGQRCAPSCRYKPHSEDAGRDHLSSRPVFDNVAFDETMCVDDPSLPSLPLLVKKNINSGSKRTKKPTKKKKSALNFCLRKTCSLFQKKSVSKSNRLRLTQTTVASKSSKHKPSEKHPRPDPNPASFSTDPFAHHGTETDRGTSGASDAICSKTSGGGGGTCTKSNSSSSDRDRDKVKAKEIRNDQETRSDQETCRQ
jgi:hypothetical protein